MNIYAITLALSACLSAQAPDYTAAGVVNGATFLPDSLAPNTIVSMFGSNLTWEDNGVGIGPEDMKGGKMPTKVGGVQVFVSGYPAHLYYVSKGQVNFLMPSYLLPGPKDIWLTRDGMTGGKVQIELQSAAPALFMANGLPISTHLDYSLVTNDAPARPREVIILWATGLGCIQNQDMWDDGVAPSGAQWLCSMDQFRVWIAGAASDPGLVLYAGVTPGFPGLYQVNFRMPDEFPENPEIRLAVGDALSPAGIVLPAR